MRTFTKALAILAATTLLAAYAGAGQSARYSGFLPDYSLLTKQKDAKGQTVMRFVSPQLASGKYRAIMIDPVEYYPVPEPDKNVDSTTLSQIQQYFDQELRKQIGELVPVVTQPGPGVIRMRVAITAVATENAKLKPRQYLPLGLLALGAKTATGRVKQDADVSVEVEMVDSQSGALLGEAVKSGRGNEVEKVEQGSEAGQKMVTLDDLKPVIDGWVKLASNFVATNLHP